MSIILYLLQIISRCLDDGQENTDVNNEVHIRIDRHNVSCRICATKPTALWKINTKTSYSYIFH